MRFLNVCRAISNQKGLSIMEIVVASGMIGMLTLAMATMFSNMARESKGLNEKLAAMETFSYLTHILSDTSVCSNAVTLPTPLTFDSTVATATGAFPSHSIPVGNTTAVQIGQPASPSSNNLIVSGIDLVNIQNAGSPDLWQGEVRVSFDQTQLVRSIKPVDIRVTFQTDPLSPANAKVVTFCGSVLPTAPPISPTPTPTPTPVGATPTPPPSGASGTVPSGTVLVDFSNCTTIDYYLSQGMSRTVTCPSGQQLVFATGVPDGSQDRVNSSFLSITPTSITVNARRDSWRMLGKCCVQQVVP